MNDLEDRLRESLRDLAEPVQARVDIDALRTGGDQLRRSRRNRWLASGVVGTAVMGLIAYGVSSQVVRAVPEPVGTVATSTLPSKSPTSVPPTATTTVRPLIGSVGDTGFFSVDLRSYGVVNDAKPDFEKLTISAERDASGYQVVVRGSSADGSHAEESGHSDGAKPVLLRLGPKLWAGVAPDQVTAMYWRNDGMFNASFKALNGLAVTALIITSDTYIDAIGAYVWRTKDGEYRDSVGRVAPSTVFKLKGRSYWFFNDTAVDLVGAGLVQPEPADGPSGWGPLPTDPASLWRSSASDAVEPGNPKSSLDSYVIGLVPVGASGPTLTVDKQVSQVLVKPLTVTGQLAFIAYGRTRTESPSLISEVHYVDAEGQQVSVPFK